MRELVIAAASASFLILYLLGERFFIEQRIGSIALRICVTGTRGKSGVTRLIASILREAGFKVLAKTTGSKPIIIFPDGREEEIRRRDVPSILEQKKLLKLGRGLGINALVSELMSILPESSYVESTQILRPHILVITNVRLDHLAQMGFLKEAVARGFASSIPLKSTVFIPQEEFFPVFQKTAMKSGSKIVQVPADIFKDNFQSKRRLPFFELKENVRLALAVAQFLGIKREVSLRGIEKVQPDFGNLKVWEAELGLPSRHLNFVNCFAANDPESTRLVLSRLWQRKIFEGKKLIGLLNFRKDRGDRTLQWLKALKENTFPEFSRFYLVGVHACAFKRRLDFSGRASFTVLKKQPPERIIEQVLKEEKEEAVLVGMGNMGGIGRKLVHYWENIGKACGL